MISGGCLCGVLRYEVEGPLGPLMHCHCSRCRKHHGAPFATFVRAPKEGFRWLSGEESVQSYSSSAGWVRRYCGHCGTKAPTVTKDGVYLPAGNLVGALEERGGFHAYVGSKAPWHLIADELPQFPAAPPAWNSPPVERTPPPVLEGATHGSCLCGAVAFSVRGRPARWMQCHCSRCRRGRSAAHGSNLFYPQAQFEWRSGQSLVKLFRLPEAERFAVSFCTRCGGGAPVERPGVPMVLVPAALLDGEPGGRPEANIHVASKANWDHFADDIPQFAGLPPA